MSNQNKLELMNNMLYSDYESEDDFDQDKYELEQELIRDGIKDERDSKGNREG